MPQERWLIQFNYGANITLTNGDIGCRSYPPSFAPARTIDIANDDPDP